MDDGSCGSDRTGRCAGRRLSRRTFLGLAGVSAVTAAAGCSGGEDPPPATTETSADQSRATATAVGEPTAATSTAAGGFDADALSASPGSHLAPADGFADASWLAERDLSVVRVTTLDASGEGSLRWALSEPGPRVVVFEVGGVVDLGGESLTVSRPNVFVAGQTAPSPGITLVRGGLHVDADNVILHHLRARPGDEVPAPIDAIGNVGGSNLIIDHCTAAWGTDEGLSTNSGPDAPDITFTNNLVAESLNDSIHPKGEHAYGTLVMNRSKRVTLAGNLWAHNVGRHPRLKGGTTTVVANNVMYDFERGTNLGGGVDDETLSSVVGNYYRGGPSTPETEPVVGTTFTDATGPIEAFVAYNETDPSTIPVLGEGTRVEVASERPLWPESLTTVGAADAYESTLATVGARPADRSPHDERVLSNVRDRSGGSIDSQSEVGGYPDFEATERSLSVPDSGLGAWLREHTAAVETN
jgi:pectate lyase